MNKRITKLAKQAYEDVIKNTPSFLVTKELYEQKFAQLIAYECMDLALGSSHREDDMGAIIANKIKKHFGVEE